MKRHTIVTFYIVAAFFISACSSYRPPESFESKMSRFKSKETDVNQVPRLALVSGNLEKVKSQRAPASLATKALKIQYSNKRLYFLTLFSQYQRMKNYTDHTSNVIKSCPHFHTGLVQHNEKYGPLKNKKVQFELNQVKGIVENSSKQVFYPELYLPLTEDQVTPTVADVIKNNNDETEEVFQQAIGLHLRKTYKELAQLCENGVSDNYYVFENLITQFSPQLKKDSAKKVLSTLLKTTIFSNMAILYSLDSLSSVKKKRREIASLGPDQIYTHEVMKRLGVVWARNYFHQAYGLKNLP